MRTMSLRVLATAAIALAAFAGSAAAQTPSPILNTLELRKLVTSEVPADHARLSVHFAALADRYAGEARTHTSMATAAMGNPNRNTSSGMQEHCRRLAALNNESAATLRELAAYHGTLAGGAAAVAPRDGARFEAGVGAPAPTEAELRALAAKAATPADHRALQEYFRTLAARYTSEATDHTDLAMRYRGTRIAQAALHHDRLARTAREEAKEATAAADMHGQMANVAR